MKIFKLLLFLCLVVTISRLDNTYAAPGTNHVIGKVGVNSGSCVYDVKEAFVISQ